MNIYYHQGRLSSTGARQLKRCCNVARSLIVLNALFVIHVHTLVMDNAQRNADDAAFRLKASDQQLLGLLVF